MQTTCFALLRISAILGMALVVGSCGGSSKKSKAFLVFPNAVFVPGTPSGNQVSAQKPLVTAPQGSSFTPGNTYTWKVNFKNVTELSVTHIVVQVTELEGYFVVPLEPTEVTAGEVDVPMFVSEAVGPTICQRDYRGLGTCYTPMSEGTTDIGFSAARATDAAQPTLNWSAAEEVSVTIVSTTVPDPDRDDPPPSTGGHGMCVAAPMPGCGCTLQSCCTQTQCGYLVNNTWFPCQAMGNCAGAAQQAVNFCGCGR